jgi:hypothetical protein
MLPPAATRVLDRAARGEELARAAAAESVLLDPVAELDACHDGKPVCTVRPLALLAGVPVFAESAAPEPILAARRDSLARALSRPVAFLGSGAWTLVAP